MGERVRADDFARWGASRRQWRPNTQTKYAYLARRTHRQLPVQLARARTDHLLDIYDRLPPSASSRNQWVQAMRAYFDWQISLGRRANNPADDLPTLRRRRSHPKSNAPDVARKVLASAAERSLEWEVHISMYYRAGLRKSEARTLRWVQWDGGYLQVHGKGARDRTVPLPAVMLDLLAVWEVRCPSRSLLFPSSRTSGPWSSSWVANVVREVGEAAGVDGLHPHVGRHTYARRMLDLGADIDTVRQLLGHQSIQSTQIYTQARPAHLRDAVDRFDI